MRHYLLFYLLFFPAIAAAADQAQCAATIRSSDSMAYDTRSISVPAHCQEFTLTLLHTGQFPKSAMGHNWVLTRPDDEQELMKAAVAAGLDNDYLPDNDPRIIAATSMIGGGEETSTTFSTKGLDKDTDYVYFCSFPGHRAMRGTLRFEP